MDMIQTDGSVSRDGISAQAQIDRVLQRYSDLYEFAPNGYVSFDRSGRIAEINLTASNLFGIPRTRLIGMPFVVFVARDDTTLFLHHLLKCRSSEGNVQTELRLKDAKGKIIYAELFSTPVAASLHNGTLVYQTAIIDLTEGKRVEDGRAEAARRQGALYELSLHHQKAKTFDEIYRTALDVILTALPCERASILLYDEQQVMRFVAWRGLSEKYRKAVEGHSPWKRDDKDPQPVWIADIERADISRSLKSIIRSEGIGALGFIPLVSSGKLLGKFMIYRGAPHSLNDEELKLAMTIARQLAQTIQLKRDEGALRAKEAELEQIVTQTPFMLTRCTRDLRYRYVSRAYAEMVGRKSEEIAGKPIVQIVGEEGLKTILPYIDKVLKGQATEYEMQIPFQGIGVRWLHSVYTPDRDSNGKVIGWFASISDIGVRKKAEALLQKSKELLEKRVRERTRELHVANKELQAEIERRKGLEGEILAVSDREQQRLGQELHDGLCQHLAAVAFMARSVALRLRDHRVVDAADIEKIAELVNNAVVDTRNLSRALHRMDVDAAGFVVALQDLVDREIWRTPCCLEVKPSFYLHNDAAAAHLYRIAREAVINANKHAQARRITVRLEAARGGMVLRVIDDGIGFPKDLKPQQGLGYHIMKYRAQLIGGRLEIDSPRRGGTRVSCYLPTHGSRSPKAQHDDKLPDIRAKLSTLRVAAVLTL